ncbi:MAG: DUF3892 domain-containing protein [Ardenticatenales bacterium]
MIDHTRMATGFDYEILFGGEFFLAIFDALYAAGALPRSIPLGGVTATLEAPTSVAVLPLGENADLAVAVPFSAAGTVGVAGLLIALAASPKVATVDDLSAGIVVAASFAGFDAATDAALQQLGVRDAAATFLGTALARTFTIKGGRTPVIAAESRRVAADAQLSAAWGLYVNKDYRIAPPPGPPEDAVIPRGDVSLAATFLPADRSFVLGASAETFRRLAANKWHSWAEEQPDGTFRHPLEGADGEYRSVNITGSDGVLTIRITGEVEVPHWFNADLTIRYEARPHAKDNGDLDVPVTLAEFQADTGILADIVAGLLGGLFIGIVGAVIVYEVIENAKEDAGEAKAQKQTSEITTLFESIPDRLDIGRSRPDPFFELVHWVAYRYREANVDEDGMSYAAVPEVMATPEPVAILLVDKRRDPTGTAFAGLEALVYEIAETGDRIELAIGDVLRRIANRELALATLTPVAVRRERTMITDLKFDTGLDLTIEEAIALQTRRVLAVVGCQLIRPAGKRPYFRDVPDDDPGDNLEALPTF